MRFSTAVAIWVLLAGCRCGANVTEARDPAASRGQTLVLPEAGGRSRVPSGQQFEVRLRAQIGAGFRWDLAGRIRAGFSLVENKVLDSATDKDGSTQVQVFRFRAPARGHVELKFEYRRPWMKDSSPARIVIHDVTVAG
jgi:predicted secreted protein